jgi:hypothetical protein
MTVSDKKFELFNILKKEKKEVLLDLLMSAYAVMKSRQQSHIFGNILSKSIATDKNLKESKILDEVNDFYKQSLAGYYYAPFEINSKNFMNVPEETDQWCEQISLLLEKSSQLTKLGKHEFAVKCFQMLFELMDRLGDDEIIFGDEISTWMIGANEEDAIKAYVTSLTKTKTAQEFVEYISPLLIRDSQESFSNNVYAKIKAIAKKEQKNKLEETIKFRGIKIKNLKKSK